MGLWSHIAARLRALCAFVRMLPVLWLVAVDVTAESPRAPLSAVSGAAKEWSSELAESAYPASQDCSTRLPVAMLLLATQRSVTGFQNTQSKDSESDRLSVCQSRRGRRPGQTVLSRGCHGIQRVVRLPPGRVALGRCRCRIPDCKAYVELLQQGMGTLMILSQYRQGLDECKSSG